MKRRSLLIFCILVLCGFLAPGVTAAWVYGDSCLYGTRGWYSVVDLEELQAGITGTLWAGPGKCDLSKGNSVGLVTIYLNDLKDEISLEFRPDTFCEVTDWQLWIKDEPIPVTTGFSKWFKGEGEFFAINLDTPFTDEAGDGVYYSLHSEVICGVPPP